MKPGVCVAIGVVLAASSLAAVAATPGRKGAAASAPVIAAARPAAPASAPSEFAGSLVAGTTYVADMIYDGEALHIWRPLKDVQPGKETSWTIDWVNLDKFPALKTPATRSRPQRFRFRVLSADNLSGTPGSWVTTYHCELLKTDPLPPPAAAARRR